MPKRISNRISISSIDDGTTIHGGLRSTKALAQGYGSGTFSPDWSESGNTGAGVEDKRPIIYMTLLSGSTVTTPYGDDVNWYWNETLLTFDANGYSTNAQDADHQPLFQKLSGTDRVLWEGLRMPSLRINNNLAIAGSLDDDVIQARGTVELSGQQVDFSSGLTIRLCELNANGYLGVINFVDGKSTLSSDDDTVTAWTELYSAGVVTGWTCDWYLNGQPINTSSTLADDGAVLSNHTGYTNYNQIQVSGQDNGGVVDIATLTCVFKMLDTTTNAWREVATVTETIDDISDEEYMYVFFEISGTSTQNDGSPVSLRRNQSVTFTAYVAKEDDAEDYNTTYQNFYFQPRNASGETPAAKPIASLGNEAPAAVGSKFYAMTTIPTSGGAKRATMTVTFDEVQAQGKNISGIILATD